MAGLTGLEKQEKGQVQVETGRKGGLGGPAGKLSWH